MMPASTPRDAAIRDFLAASGWAGARRMPLAGDASARRYERIARAGRTAMLMDIPPASGLDPAPFLAVSRWLGAGGFSAPAILAADEARGLVLLEDLGDDLLATLCDRRPELEPALYEAAIDVLAAIHGRAPPAHGGSGPGPRGWSPPPYDAATYLREARLAVEWYLPATTGHPAPAEDPALTAEFEALVSDAVAAIPPSRPAAIYRDYHAENLLWLPDRAGLARIGLLDYQDMLTGHPAYDLVSLLEDARRDVGPELREAMTARYVARTGAEPEAFRTAAHILSAQRNLKILGLFTRLCRRDGKPRYLACLPRVWGHLARDLAHPALAPLRGWTARHLPAPETGVLAAIARQAA